MLNFNEHLTNRKAKEIYAVIRKHGVVSKNDLLDQSKVTVSTLTRILEELVAAKLLEEHGYGESTGGRKPILYRTNPAYAYAFGLDISRTYSRLILCDLHMNELDSVSWMMTDQMTPPHFLQQVVTAVTKISANYNLNRSAILGMGIGAVGPLDRSRGMILEPLYFPASGWKNLEICTILEQSLQFPVLLDNGANTGILGEYWAGTPRDYQHLLYIRAGVGLRSSMIVNGQIMYGAVDMEGSLGQMIIQSDGVDHRDRSHIYGCLESYVSIYALEKEAQSKLRQGRRSVLSEMVTKPGDVEFNHLLAALEANDAMVTEIFTQAATYFGIGLANLLNILHPQMVILGGPLITSNELFYQICTQVALKNTYYYPVYKVLFSRGKLAESALAIGAAVMVINSLTE